MTDPFDVAFDDNLLKLASDNGTPSYIYNLSILRRRIAEIRDAFDIENTQLLFATMANPAPDILAEIAHNGVGACVNSIPHLNLSLECGIAASRIQFTSTGIAVDDMRSLAASKIAVNLDSQLQLTSWYDIVEGDAAGIRINAGSLINLQGELCDRIGVDVAEIPDCLAIARERRARINGVHVYVGTNFQTPEEMFPVLNAFFNAAKQFPDLEYVNIGGGIGVDYTRRNASGFNVRDFGSTVSKLHRALERAADKPIRLFFEPGRGLIAGSSVFLTKVTDVKRLRGRTYIAVDGSIAVFPRPFHQANAAHFVRRLGGGKENARSCDATIVGRTTFSRDILANCSMPDDVRVGQVLAFSDAGAYCSSMISRFLGQPEPARVVLQAV